LSHAPDGAGCKANARGVNLSLEAGMKILVIDDHPLIHTAMPLVLKGLDQKADILQAQTFSDALRLAQQHADINLILLDLGLPDMAGLDALAQLRNLYAAIPVVVLSAHDDAPTVTSAIEGGAMGFIPKTTSTESLVNALRFVLAGGVYLPREMLRGGSNVVGPTSGVGAAPTVTAKELGLTERQTDVLSLLVQGKPNKLIMRELNLAEGTVKLHVTAILRALNVANRTQAVITVAQRGLTLGRLDKPRRPD
jgi:DNA-binding NarL/FixJ family response regulator